MVRSTCKEMFSASSITVNMLEFLSIWYLSLILGAYILTRTVYRLYFHPLSGFPGPKLTAVTHLYEFYWNVVRPGRFLFKIEQMHEKYGPIVRINPREVHISDPAFYEEIYASGSRKRHKDASFVATYGAPDTMLSTVTHEHHRFRRNILNEYFSKRSVLNLSGIINERIQKLMSRFQEAEKNGTVLCLDMAFAALTSDVITSYCCGRHWQFLEDEHFRNDVRRAAEDSVEFAHIHRFFPWLTYIWHVVSPQTLSKLMPGKSALFAYLQSFLTYSTANANGNQPDKSDQRPCSGPMMGTMVAALTHPRIPPEERTANRLRNELFIVLGAGTETTARVLTVAAYHLGAQPTIRDKLRSELKELLPTPTHMATWPELAKLPYLSAVINESLRLSHGVIGRLPRVAPTEFLDYNGYVMPPGTPISSSSYIIHRNTALFPDPDVFDPQRWIRAAEEGVHLERYIVSFSKGSRSCIGINLAYMELYATIASLARWFDIELYNTTQEDVEIIRDMVVGYTRYGPMRVYAKLSMAG